jgi:hypothetical protein
MFTRHDDPADRNKVALLIQRGLVEYVFPKTRRFNKLLLILNMILVDTGKFICFRPQYFLRKDELPTDGITCVSFDDQPQPERVCRYYSFFF